jgi:opine dehydrogenase
MSAIKTVAVLGAGHGGCAVAGDLTLRGWEVRLHGRSAERVAALGAGITVRGVREGLARPALVTTDLAAAVSGADLVVLVVPSVAHGPYATALAPLLPAGATVFLDPGHTGGALHFAAAFARAGGRAVRLGETVTLTHICRMEGPATVAIYRITSNLRFAALPGRDTTALAADLEPLFPDIVPVGHVLETGLMNLNAVIHPPGMLMNAGWIEFTRGDFLFYREALTPSVARMIEGVDAERLAVARALGVDVPAFIDYFCAAGLTTEEARVSRSVYRAMQESGPNRTIKSPPSLDHRYVHEDVGYGLVPMAEFGVLAGVATPVIDAVIRLCSVAMERDYRREGLNLAGMGLAGLSREALMTRIREGLHR